jgi:hypothetical protein
VISSPKVTERTGMAEERWERSIKNDIEISRVAPPQDKMSNATHGCELDILIELMNI